MKKRFVLLFVGITLLGQNALAGQQWLLEKLGKSDFAIARSYLDDFERLSPKEKSLLYYLSRAAIAGRDIYYDQRHRNAVEIRKTIESIVDRDKKFLTYAKYLWANNSQYHARTGLKLSPPFVFEELQKAMPGKDLSNIKVSIFDREIEPALTNLTPNRMKEISSRQVPAIFMTKE